MCVNMQEEYYVTHQCFLSTRSLYLVVWNITEGEDGIDCLGPWLHNIQVSATYNNSGSLPSIEAVLLQFLNMYLLASVIWLGQSTNKEDVYSEVCF